MAPPAQPPCGGWRERGWVVLPVSLPLGYMKVPRKSQGPPGARAKDAPEALHWPGRAGLAEAQQRPSPEAAQPPVPLTPSLLPAAPAVPLLPGKYLSS